MASWLDRWAERTRAKDRQVIADQREVDELRNGIPREPVVGPSGFPSPFGWSAMGCLWARDSTVGGTTAEPSA